MSTWRKVKDVLARDLESKRFHTLLVLLIVSDVFLLFLEYLLEDIIEGEHSHGTVSAPFFFHMS
jgi:hypothetical protein